MLYMVNFAQKAVLTLNTVRPEFFFYQLIYKPSYCNFLKSRKKKAFQKLFFYFIGRLQILFVSLNEII